MAVLVDTSTSWGRRIIAGIHNYVRRNGVWQVFVEARGMEEHLEVPRGWDGDGVIARIGNEAMSRQLRALRLPVVNVSSIQLPGPEFPRVINDMGAVAEMAATHFAERGFRHFAYFSLMGLSYVAAQQDAFVNRIRTLGHDCAVFGVQTHGGAEPDWNVDLAKLAAWLKSLPKPVGIFTWNASSAHELLYGCQAGGLLVPEEVAVLSGSDDDLLCEVSHIPISAIMVAAEQNGFAAASLLDRLMHGRAAPKSPLLIPPLRVVTRQSTDTLAVQDSALVKALSFIRENASRYLQVTDVARHAGVSRRVLERRFAQALGRTPAEEIRRVHLERAKELLQKTDLPIPDIAEASGFGSPEYLAYVFRTELKRTPLRYRKEIRNR